LKYDDDESCFAHVDADEQPADLRWALALEPSQIDGFYWCSNGSHYMRVSKELLWSALHILIATDRSVPV
jgi:hypothetical protein